MVVGDVGQRKRRQSNGTFLQISFKQGMGLVCLADNIVYLFFVRIVFTKKVFSVVHYVPCCGKIQLIKQL